MKTDDALSALSALAHPTRLAVFRLLVKAGPDGLPAGQIATATGSLHNTLSKNLALLSDAGLIHGDRDGRVIRYRAGMDAMQALIGYLMEDCCGGDATLCAPVLEQLTPERDPQ